MATTLRRNLYSLFAIKKLKREMVGTPGNLEFEKAAMIRDRILRLRKDGELLTSHLWLTLLLCKGHCAHAPLN